MSDGEVLLAGLLFFQPQYRKLGGQKLARSWRALKGWRKKAPTRSRRPSPRMIWSAVCWEMEKPLMAIHVLITVVTYCRPGELLQSMREHLTRLMHGKRLVTPPPHRSKRRDKQNTELRRHDRLEKPNLSLDHQSGCSPGGQPSLREDLRVPIRRFHQGVPESNTNTGTEGHCSASVPPFWSVAGQSGTTPHNAGDQKTEKVEIRQQHCQVRKIWKIGANSVRSQQKPFEATDSALEKLIFVNLRVEDVLRPSLMVAASS